MQNGDEIDGDGPESERIRAELKADITEQEKLIASSGTPGAPTRHRPSRPP